MSCESQTDGDSVRQVAQEWRFSLEISFTRHCEAKDLAAAFGKSRAVKDLAVGREEDAGVTAGLDLDLRFDRLFVEIDEQDGLVSERRQPFAIRAESQVGWPARELQLMPGGGQHLVRRG